MRNGVGTGGMAGFLFKDVFRLVLTDTGLKASVVALDLQRERSLMYKWLSGASVPPASYVPGIVGIVQRRSSGARQMILADHLRDIVRRSELSPSLRTALLKLEDPSRFLAECIDLSLGLAPVPAPPAERETGEARRRRLPLLAASAAFATLFGGIAWNLLNRLAGWQYFMGSADSAMAALPAMAWGAITMAPIAAPFIFLCERGTRGRAAAAAAAFTAVGAACAVLFYAGGIRAAVEAADAGYAVREAVMAVLFGIVTSLPPQAAAVATLGRHTRVRRAAALCLVPTGAALLAFLFTLLVDRPEPEVLQLRGLAVGAALRLSLFGVLAASFLGPHATAGRPDSNAAS
jgi:hypothetical protein